MGLQLDVKPRPKHHCQTKHQDGLPGELRFAATLLRRLVRLDQAATNCPLSQLIGGEFQLAPARLEILPAASILLIRVSSPDLRMGIMPDLCGKAPLCKRSQKTCVSIQ